MRRDAHDRRGLYVPDLRPVHVLPPPPGAQNARRLGAGRGGGGMVLTLRTRIRAVFLTCPDTTAPRFHFPSREPDPDAWLKELKEKIAADIRREEEAARRHMEFLCSLSHLVEER